MKVLSQDFSEENHKRVLNILDEIQTIYLQNITHTALLLHHPTRMLQMWYIPLAHNIFRDDGHGLQIFLFTACSLRQNCNSFTHASPGLSTNSSNTEQTILLEYEEEITGRYPAFKRNIRYHLWSSIIPYLLHLGQGYNANRYEVKYITCSTTVNHLPVHIKCKPRMHRETELQPKYKS